MSNNKSNNSRRNLLKSIAGGSGAVVASKYFPESWSKPIVDSIILPAHALTTVSRCYGDEAAERTGTGDNNGENLSPMVICACSEGNMVTVQLQGRNNILSRKGVLNIDGSYGRLEVIGTSPNCTISIPNDLALRARITAISESSITIEADDKPYSVESPGDSLSGFRISADVGECPSFPALTGSGGSCD